MCLVEREMTRTKQTARMSTARPTATKVWVETEDGGGKRAKVGKVEKAKAEKVETVEKVEMEK